MNDDCLPSPDALLALIRKRRSFKPVMLKPKAPSREVLTQLMEAANWAPSHGQTEPWRFTAFTGDGRARLGDLWAGAYQIEAEKKGTFAPEQMEVNRKKAFNAPAWISLGMQPAFKPDGARAFPEEEESQAVACAIQNLHLMATAHGMGGQWTTNRTFCHESVAAAVGLTPPGRLVGFFLLGYPGGDWPVGKRGDLAGKVSWES